MSPDEHRQPRGGARHLRLHKPDHVEQRPVEVVARNLGGRLGGRLGERRRRRRAKPLGEPVRQRGRRHARDAGHAFGELRTEGLATCVDDNVDKPRSLPRRRPICQPSPYEARAWRYEESRPRPNDVTRVAVDSERRRL